MKLKEKEGSTANCGMTGVSERFSVYDLEMADYFIISVHDNLKNKVVCHLVHDNGIEYCREMANKIVNGLNAR